MQPDFEMLNLAKLTLKFLVWRSSAIEKRNSLISFNLFCSKHAPNDILQFVPPEDYPPPIHLLEEIVKELHIHAKSIHHRSTK